VQNRTEDGAINGRNELEAPVTADSYARVPREYLHLLDIVPVGILSLDPQGKVLYANPALVSIMGLPSIESAQEIHWPSFPPFVDAGIDRDIRLCLESGSTVCSEHPYNSAQGKSLYLQFCLTPVRDERGSLGVVQVVVEDITEQKLVEKVLREYQLRFEDQTSELNKLSHAIEQSANMVVITDLEGHIEYVNPKFVEVTGYSTQEVLGKNPRILKSGEQTKEFYRELWQTITSGRQWHGEFHNKRKDGTFYWEQSSIAPIFNSTGRMTHFIAIKEDITDRKKAEAMLHRFNERLQILHEIDQSVLAAQLTDTIAVAAIHRIGRLIPCQRVMVLALDEGGEIKMLGAASADQVGSTPDAGLYQEMFAKPPLGSGFVQGCDDLAALRLRSPLQEALFQVGMRSYVAVPLFIQSELVGTLNLESTQPKAFTPDHITIALEVAASLAVAIRQARLYERAQQEIADRMRAEAATRKYTLELEARNAELDAFAHTVAHDLKNPVTSMLGYADVLRRNYATLPAAMHEEFLQVIARSARKMAEIIDELLLLSSVRGMKEIDIQPLEMGRVVAEARGRLLQQIEEYEGLISLPQEWPVALGYGPWVEAVWTNYISNALRYGGQPPRVELGATVQEDGWIRFWVHDNGPGLSAEEQTRLFTPFERLPQARAEGHGLGLSIVQRIIKRLGGQVGVESNEIPGQGSTFYFTLPALRTD
jgi:PAS domain S-box-containing protein